MRRRMLGGKKKDRLRRAVCLLAACVLALLLAPRPLAAGTEEDAAAQEEAYRQQIEEQMEAYGVDALEDSLPDEAREVLREMGVEGVEIETLASMDFGDILGALVPSLDKNIRKPLRAAGLILCVLLLCAVLGLFQPREEGASAAYHTVASLAAAACLLAPVAEFLVRIAGVLTAASGFMMGYVPVFGGMLVAQGTPTAAAGYSAAVLLVCELVSQGAKSLILPLAGIFLGLAALSGLSENAGVHRIPAAFKSVAKWVLGLGSTLVVGFLGIQTAIAASSDTMLLRGAKFAVSGFVPVVGGALSDALSVVAGSASLIKAGTGVFGILALAAILVPVIVEIALWLLGVKLCAAAAQLLDVPGVQRILQGVGDVIEIVFALFLSVASVFLISTAVMLSVKA